MVKVNGEEFAIYELDNTQSFISRLASDMDTLPKYIFFPSGIPETFDEDIIVENLLADIKKSSLSISQIYSKLENKLWQQDLNPVNDIFKYFIVYNKTLATVPSGMIGSVLLNIQDQIEKLGVDMDCKNVWDVRKYEKEELEKEIRKNKAIVSKQMGLFRQYQKINKGITHTSFDVEKTVFDLVLNISGISIMEVFNNIVTNEFVPMASMGEYYKILKDFRPPEDWSDSVEDAIIVKVLEKKDQKRVKITDYVDVTMTIDDGKLVARLTVNSSGSNLTRDQFISRFLSIFNGVSVTNIEETQVSGFFYLPNQGMNRYVMADMVMNNPLFSFMMSIDESEKSTKQKSGVYIHIDQSRIGKVAVNIIEKVVIDGENVLRGQPKGLFKVDEKYTSIRVNKARNTEAVKNLQEFLSKMFVIYNNDYYSIVEEYRKFIPDFGKEVVVEKVKKRKKALKDVAPEIFLSNYSRKCGNVPTIITDEEAENTDKAVMLFPKSPEEGIQRNYVCNFPDKQYPGLMKNKMKNSDKFPYIPCCYARNQADIQGSLYRKYYFNEEEAEKVASQRGVYLTNKFLPVDDRYGEGCESGRYGVLPENITKIFTGIDSNPNHKYLRKGVVRSKSSFIHCILDAFNIEDILNIEDPDELSDMVNWTRMDMANMNNAMLCTQEMYEYSPEEIKDSIGDLNVYFSPRKYIALLEKIYRCNIILFSSINSKGEMILPNHAQAYYKTKRKAPFIFVYEHMGSESDNAEYPQCELIVRCDSQNLTNAIYTHPYESNMGKAIHKIYSTLRQSYVMNEKIKESVFNISIPVLSQNIDSYGKCRMIRVGTDSGKEVLILTEPIQPFDAPQKKGYIKASMRSALEVIKKLGMQITKQSVVNGYAKEISGIIGNIRVSIPIKDTNLLPGVPIFSGGIKYPETSHSSLRVFNYHKKLSRYIVEYMFWMYSRFLSGNEPTLNTVATFAENMFHVEPGYEYGNVAKYFTLNSSIIKGGKIVVESKEHLKRLIYVLRIAIMRNSQKILEYKDKEGIDNFYEDITDFSQVGTQVILQGEESVRKWENEGKKRDVIYDEVKLGDIEPYFFRNQLVSDNVYIAQNTTTLKNALSIAFIWDRDGFNPGMNTEEDVDGLDYTLYSYVNKQNIIQYGEDTEIKIMGYKIEDRSYFTVLLELD